MLSKFVAKDACANAVKVGFEGMTDGFVEKYARATSPHYYGHFATFGFDGVEEYGGARNYFLGQFFNEVIVEKFVADVE